jgi:hypothetical protein
MSGPSHEFACPACSRLNPASRLLCQACGALLEPERPRLAPAWARDAPWRRRAALILLGLAAVSAVAAVFMGAAVKANRGLLATAPPINAGAAPTPVQAAPVQAAPEPVLVSPRSISASASSELPPTGDVDYSIRNTLDGDGRTAWNNHSAVAGSGVGETLTYRFPRAVHLVRIGLVNGYVKTAELRADNSRIRGVLITTDSRTLHATLADTASRQRLDRDFGATRTITLRVTSIYPGARYTDLALTEIQFWAVPG